MAPPLALGDSPTDRVEIFNFPGTSAVHHSGANEGKRQNGCPFDSIHARPRDHRARPRRGFTALRDLADRARKAVLADDLIGYLGIDRQLHLALLAHLGHPRLVDIVGQPRDQTRLCGLDRLVGTQVPVASIREHDELLDAVEADRTEDAVEVMRRHLKHARGLWAGRAESKSDG
ncbi:FCD domain-containing protein [Saccharopolyspora sp. ASAGF58]|uniref:FCD domain-containing protein n=1 Tax=Saccharopolyspora sp. ASAGF58 TaxID=2719023 RepID=UPI001B301804